MVGGQDQLLQVSWTLTTDAKAVIEGVIEPKKFPHSLQLLARVGNWQLESFFDTVARNYQMGNQLLVDHIQESYVVEVAKIFARRDCYDSEPTRPPKMCRAWYLAGNCSESFVQEHCPLSCGLCKPVAGEPGQPCASDKDCLSGHCAASSADTQTVCLTDDPRSLGEPCGSDLQCSSVKCDRQHNICVQ